MYSQKQIELTHEIVYLAKESPIRDIDKFVNSIAQPVIDTNVAVWLAEDMGFIEVNQKTRKYEVVKEPETWQFSDNTNHLIEQLAFTFDRFAEREKDDLSEGQLNIWLNGYAPHIQILAMRNLLNRGMIGEYELQQRVLKGKKAKTEKYTFFGAAGTIGEQRGRKQFPDQSKLID